MGKKTEGRPTPSDPHLGLQRLILALTDANTATSWDGGFGDAAEPSGSLASHDATKVALGPSHSPGPPELGSKGLTCELAVRLEATLTCALERRGSDINERHLHVVPTGSGFGFRKGLENHVRDAIRHLVGEKEARASCETLRPSTQSVVRGQGPALHCYLKPPMAPVRDRPDRVENLTAT